MKKLLLLAAVAAGIGVLVKTKSQQLKEGAARVADDPRVHAAGEKIVPAAAAVKEKAGAVGAKAAEKLHRHEDGAEGAGAGATAGTAAGASTGAGATAADSEGWHDEAGYEGVGSEGSGHEGSLTDQLDDPLNDPLPGPPTDPQSPTG